MDFIFRRRIYFKEMQYSVSIKELYNKIVIFRKYVFQTKESRR